MTFALTARVSCVAIHCVECTPTLTDLPDGMTMRACARSSRLKVLQLYKYWKSRVQRCIANLHIGLRIALPSPPPLYTSSMDPILLWRHFFKSLLHLAGQGYGRGRSGAPRLAGRSRWV